MEHKDAEISQYPIDKERELLHLIQTGDSKEARSVLNEILGAVFFSSGGKFDVVKARVLELLVLLSRARPLKGSRCRTDLRYELPVPQRDKQLQHS